VITPPFETASAKLSAGACLTAWNWSDGSDFNTQENTNANLPVGFRPVLFKDFYAATMGDYPVGAQWPVAIVSGLGTVL
jgi:hypothetical protein